ncbi:MAG: hypothetical protein OEM62_00855 [Acidobacteriota bacterium]|nr:hypothetical protein [Acidobacteriota bacterium]
MKRLVIVIVSLALLASTWAALDDITTGHEPSFALEWTMVAVTGCWFAGLVVFRRQLG